MLVAVMGPVEAAGVLERRDRAALAVLVLHRGQRVGVDRLADALWPEHLPSSWRKQVQIVMGRLRKALGQDSIETGTEAYRLTVGPEATDVGIFERLIRDGRRHLADDDPQRAVADLARSLELWRGTPYLELESWEPARAEVARLEELHRSVEEDLVDALLAAGDTAEVLSRAAALVRAEPLRERRWAQLALARYRAGRQGDALATLREAREVLVEALGIDPGADLANLELAMLRQEPSLMVGTSGVSGDSPWPGLKPYGEQDADLFFGREGDVVECVERLLDNGLLVVGGASGCGKSSLLRAGLIPELGRRGLSAVLLRASDGGLDRTLRDARGRPGVVVIDQFEEFYADDAAATDPDAIVTAVVALAEAGTRVVIAIRGDHLGRLAVDPVTARAVERGLHLLGPLTGDSLRAAIEGPAARAGLRCGPGLVEMLLRDAEGEPGALPLLSHALAETWARRSGAVLTVEDYVATGGMRGAVARSAEEFYESLPPERQRLVRSLLLRLVVPTDEGVPVRRRIRVSALMGGGDRAAVVESMVGARLLTVEDEHVVISHEALTRAWPRLRDWLAEDTTRLQLVRRLESDAAWWDAHGRPDDSLYRGATLQAVSQVFTGPEDDLGDPDATFLATSRAAADRQERDAGQRARAMARRNRGLAALLVVAVVVGVLANIGRIRAAKAERQALIESLVTTSRVVRDSDRGLAALLAVEAYREAPGPLTHSALLSTFTAESTFLGEVYRTGTSFVAAAIPGTSTALVVPSLSAADNPWSPAVVDLGTGEAEDLWIAGIQALKVAVSGDGSTAVVASTRNLECLETLEAPSPYCVELTVLDLRTGETALEGVFAPFALSDVALNHDGSILAAAASPHGRITWWRIPDGSRNDVPGLLTDDAVEQWRGGPFDTGSVLFGPDGTLFMTDRAGNVRAVDLHDADLARIAAVPAGFAQTNLELVGTTLVTSGHLGIAAIDTTTMAVLWTQAAAGSGTCTALAASALAGRLYCGTPAGVVEVRDLVTGERTGEPISARRGGVSGLAVIADGRELVVFGDSVPVISRWRLDGSGPSTRLVAAGHVPQDGWGADGESIIVGRPNGTGAITSFATWDTTTDLELLRVDGSPALRWLLPGLLATGGLDQGGLATFDIEDQRAGRTASLGYLVPERMGVFTTQAASRAYFWNGANQLSRINSDTLAKEAPDFRLHVNAQLLALSDTASGDRVVASFYSPANDRVEHVVLSGTTGGELARADPAEGLNLAAVSADGTLVGSSAGRITRYDLDTFEPIARFPAAYGRTNSLQFSRGGDLLLAVGASQVALYDVETGIRIGEPIVTSGGPAAAGAMRNGFLHPDGDLVAVAAADGVMVWDIDAEHLAQAACRLAGRNLSEEEWASYLHDFGPYRQTCPAG